MQEKKDEYILNFILKSNSINLFVSKTVGQLLKGYEDPLLRLGKIFSTDVKDTKFGLMKDVNEIKKFFFPQYFDI